MKERVTYNQFAMFEFYMMLSLIIFPHWKSGSFQIILAMF